MPLIAALASAIATEAASSTSFALLRDIAGVQDEQLAALKEIRQDVKTMLEGPWRKAQLLLEEAAHTRDDGERRARLREARDALFDGHSLEPEATPRRAAIGIDLALVHGLLREPQAAMRWALRAHRDQSNAVAAAVPTVVKLLNTRIAALKAPIEGDFWSLVDRSRNEDPKGTDRWLREKYEGGEVSTTLPPAEFMADVNGVVTREEGVSQVVRALSGRWGAAAAHAHFRLWAWEDFLHRHEGSADRPAPRPFLTHVAMAETTTDGGRELMRLHRMSHDVDEYRRVCLALDPAAKVPAYELRVNLSQPRRARITFDTLPTTPQGQELAWRGAAHKITGVAFSPDGGRILAASGNVAYILESRDGKEFVRISHGRMRVGRFSAAVSSIGVIWGVAFSPDGRRIATAGADHTARVWSAESGEELLRIRHLSVMGYVRAVAFSPDGRRLATAAGDHTVRVWDTEDGRQLLKVSHDKPAWSVAFDPEGTRFASTGEDDSARVWDSRDGRELLRLGCEEIVLGVAFSPDGRVIATVGPDSHVWDGQTGRKLTFLGVAGDVAFSPDGTSLAITSGDTARIIAIRDGKELECFDHDGLVQSVAFSPDGRRLATGSDDEVVRVWRVAGQR